MALEKLLVTQNMPTALLLVEKGANPWDQGGPYISAVHVATHIKPSSRENASHLELFLKKAMATPVVPTTQATLSFIQLALDIGSLEIWTKFQDFIKSVQNVREPDGWTIKDLSSRANHPFGLKDMSEELEPYQFLGPSVLVIPQAWTINARDRNLIYEISPTGLEVECSSQLGPLNILLRSFH